jgi:hypothetical protein
MKISYFADTTERGDRKWKQSKREGDFPNNSIKWLLLELNLEQDHTRRL